MFPMFPLFQVAFFEVVDRGRQGSLFLSPGEGADWPQLHGDLRIF
jgi:hypothetical protein